MGQSASVGDGEVKCEKCGESYLPICPENCAACFNQSCTVAQRLDDSCDTRCFKGVKYAKGCDECTYSEKLWELYEREQDQDLKDFYRRKSFRFIKTSKQ